MIVVDASIFVAWLLGARPGRRLGDLLRSKAALAAPHLVDAEVAHALRRHNLRGLLASDHATAAIADFRHLPFERFPHDWLVERAFALRHNATIYDALYIALAERLGAPLLTQDRGLALIPGVTAPIEIVE